MNLSVLTGSITNEGIAVRLVTIEVEEDAEL